MHDKTQQGCLLAQNMHNRDVSVKNAGIREPYLVPTTPPYTGAGVCWQWTSAERTMSPDSLI